jgi:hypothetical protein
MATRMLRAIPQLSCLAKALPNDNGKDEEKTDQKGAIYNKLDETKDIAVDNGYVTFTRSFKYLGSLISYNLCDNEDVTARVAATTASMGALTEVLQKPHLNLYSKYLFFVIPMNLLLWGCETWSLQQSLLNKLEVFLHWGIQCILAINMMCIKEEQIQNTKIRDIFYDIPLFHDRTSQEAQI